MVVVHIANVDTSILGGVQIAVPRIVKAQSNHATVALINTFGKALEDIEILDYNPNFSFDDFCAPYNSPDLVVFHEIYRFEYIKIYKMLKKSGIPYVIVPHGSLSKQAQKRKFWKKFVANKLFFEAFVRSAVAIQYLSDNEKNMSSFKTAPSFICGYGLDAFVEKKEKNPSDRKRIIYIGRLEIKTKGLDLLIKAVSNSRDILTDKQVHLEIYGPNYNGEHEKLNKMIDSLGVSHLIEVGNEKIGEKKKNLLLSADCFVQPSRTEGLPMGPLEAMGYGLPCIVTQGTGLGELIESNEAGIACDTSVSGIEKGLKRFLSENVCIEKMSENAMRLIEQRFSTNVVAKNNIEKYREVISSAIQN